jgi:glucose/arabinose dehydrogenase
VKLRDDTHHFPGTPNRPKPDGGWWVTPIHATLLSDGQALITGCSRLSTRKESFLGNSGSNVEYGSRMRSKSLTFLALIYFVGMASSRADLTSGIGLHPVIPSPLPQTSVSMWPTVLGWPDAAKPRVPKGFRVELFASELPNPRLLYVLPNGDVLASEATGRPNSHNPNAEDKVLRQAHMTGESANRVELFRGMKADGTAEQRSVFLEGLNQPFGMLLLNGWFYVANTDSIVRYPYKDGQTKITGKGEKILDLPTSGYHGHWTRNIIVNPQKTKIYVSVGSSSNIAEDGMDQEVRRADILEINPDGSGERIFASGLRNPVSAAFYPGTQTLWAVVNERDRLGDDVPPDYLTRVQDAGFYGWPYSYWGQHVDSRVKPQRPDLVQKAITPDFGLGNHVAPLSLDFYEGKSFPEKYRGGAFIGEHGSWNSSVMRGYQVYFVPFENGVPKGDGEPFLTGFIANPKSHEIFGRPVDVVTLRDGSLLVTDDAGGRIWRVSALGSLN